MSQKVLTARFRDLEEKGLLTRKVYAVVLQRVEYGLSTNAYEKEERQTTNQPGQEEKGDRAIPISLIVMCVLGSSFEDPAHCLFHPRLR